MEEMEAVKRTWCLGVVVAMLCLGASVAAQNGTNVNDVLVLLKLQEAWGGGTSLWVGIDPCGETWEGIICTGDRVTALYMVGRDLAGSIPTDIGSLDALQHLDISFNNGLSGELPTELGSLLALTSLSLQKCNFSGGIPSSLGQLTNLTFIALNNNQLTGSLPSSLGALTKLTWFDVAYNQLSGPLPVSTTSADRLGLDTWPVIQHIHLNDNRFSGNIPPELGNAHNCVHMLLEVNNFVGPIPDTFGNLTSLQILSLHFNGLSGPVPSTLNKIIKGAVLNGSDSPTAGLLQIRLTNNSLTGTIPNLNALNQLQYVDFSYNQFDPQPFPTWLNTSFGTIQTIRLEGASLTGPLPDNILSYPALQGLYLDSNELNGFLTIPTDIGQSLQYVFLQNNNLSNFNQLNPSTNLNVEILLQGNPVCTNPGSLVTLDPKLCNTTDNPTITQWTSSLADSNNCSFFCPSGLTLNPLRCTCSYPLIVTLEVRAPTFSNIANVTLWNSLKDETVLSLVNLSVSNEPVVKFESDQMWVRDAAFNGSQLRVDVRLFFFPLSGEVMDQATQDFITKSFTNQKVKYGSPFKPELVKEIDSSQGPAAVVHSGLSKTAYIGIGVGAGVVLLVVGFLIFLAVKMKRKAENERKKNSPFDDWEIGKDGAAPKLKGTTSFSFEEMKIMTNNFSEENTIGQGGYGKVYKGVTAGTGTTLAVKRAQEGSKQGAKEFKNEIEMLSRVHHNNLVNLVGFCFDKSEQMLVYEFMPNGTLTDWLRGSLSDQPLDWDRRLLIALGAARGLAYLHNNAEPPIIHRDVKSCNILLDKRMNAKVADFGLSASVDNASLKPAVKGTLGYLDPDYYQTSIVSPKIDVYSFGVVLLEILTGKPPVYRGNHIVKEVRNRFERDGLDGVREILDPWLWETSPEELEKFTIIALPCVEESALERPHMHEVVKQLEDLVGPKAHLMSGASGLQDVPSEVSSMARRMARRERRIALRNTGLDSEFEMGSLGSLGSFGSPGSGSSQHSQPSATFKWSGGAVSNNGRGASNNGGSALNNVVNSK